MSSHLGLLGSQTKKGDSALTEPPQKGFFVGSTNQLSSLYLGQDCM